MSGGLLVENGPTFYFGDLLIELSNIESIADKHSSHLIFYLMLLKFFASSSLRSLQVGQPFRVHEDLTVLMMLLKLLVKECFLVILFPLKPSLAEIPEHHLQVNEFLVDQLLLVLLYRLCSNVPVLARPLSCLLFLFSLNLHGLLIAGHLQSLLSGINLAWESNRAKISEDRCL